MFLFNFIRSNVTAGHLLLFNFQDKCDKSLQSKKVFEYQRVTVFLYFFKLYRSLNGSVTCMSRFFVDHCDVKKLCLKCKHLFNRSNLVLVPLNISSN